MTAATAPDRGGKPAAEKTVAELEYADLIRHDPRTDAKAAHVSTHSGQYATIALAGVAGLSTLAAKASLWVLVPAVPLLLAGLCWGLAIVVLQARLIAPNLVQGAFTDDEDGLPSAEDFYARRIAVLRPVIRRRYEAIGLASTWQLRGLWWAGVSLNCVVVLGLFTVFDRLPR